MESGVFFLSPSVELLSAIAIENCDTGVIHKCVYCVLSKILDFIDNDVVASSWIVFPVVPIIDERWADSNGSETSSI